MILIIGAGDVGSNIASDLADTHDVAVLDRDPEQIDAISSQLNVNGVVGDGRSVPVLREAGIDQAEIVIASTDSDAANVMVCNAAKRSGDPNTIARVKDVGLFRTWQSLDGNLGVDTMLCIDVLAAEALVRTIALPGAQAADTFANGQVEVAQFEIAENSPVTDQTIAEADRYASVTFAALLREDDILIPNGETIIRSGDCVVVIGSPNGISRFAKDVSSQSALDSDDNIVIAGGDTLGYQIAQQFEIRGWSPRIVERDPDQAAQLSTRLRGTSVAESNITDIEGFDADFLTDADLVVGAVDDDTNYLLAQLASERDVARTAAVVNDPTVIELFEDTGLDVVVHPEDIIAGEILQAVYGDRPEDIGVFDHDKAEAIEVVVDEESVLVGHALREAVTQLPTGVVIGAIIREGELQVPRGNKIIETGDRVIAFIDAEVASEVVEMI